MGVAARRHRLAKRQYNLPVVSPTYSSKVSSPTTSPGAVVPQSAVRSEAVGVTCSYIGNTSVPDQLGGVVFSTLAAVLNCTSSLPSPLPLSHSTDDTENRSRPPPRTPLGTSSTRKSRPAILVLRPTRLWRVSRCRRSRRCADLRRFVLPFPCVRRRFSFPFVLFTNGFRWCRVVGFPLVGAWMCMTMGVVNLLFVRPPSPPLPLPTLIHQ